MKRNHEALVADLAEKVRLWLSTLETHEGMRVALERERVVYRQHSDNRYELYFSGLCFLLDTENDNSVSFDSIMYKETAYNLAALERLKVLQDLLTEARIELDYRLSKRIHYFYPCDQTVLDQSYKLVYTTLYALLHWDAETPEQRDHRLCELARTLKLPKDKQYVSVFLKRLAKIYHYME